MIKRIINPDALNQLKAIVDSVTRIVITCHKSPDGDAIGSSLALCKVLRKMGKNATVIIPDQLPDSVSFVAQGMDYVTYSRNEINASNIIRNTQLIMALDYNTLDRVDRMKPLLEQAQVPKILIDHHLNPDTCFNVAISHPEISSTSELVFRIIDEAGLIEFVDKDVASSLFVGIMTDTGNLAFSSFYPEVYEVMAKLMEYNIDKPYLYKMAMDTVSLNSLLLQSHAVLNKMEVIDGKYALITLDREDLNKFNYKTGDSERLVNRPLSVKDIYWSTFMRDDSKYIKVSMRSEGDFAVDTLCSQYFNGGGHKHAAAGEFYGSMQEAVALYHQIVEKIKQHDK